MTSDVSAALIGTVVGWVLGLLTTPIVTWYEQRRIAVALAGPLESELRDVQVRSSLAVYYFLSKHEITRDELQWTLDTLVNADDERATTAIHAVRQLLQLRDEELAAALKDRGRSGSGTSNKRLDLPFLNAQVHRIDVFQPRIQRHLLWVAANIGIYNEIVDEAREYLRLTFTPGITPENFSNVDKNYQLTERKCAERLRIIADEARAAIRSLKAK